MSNISDLRDNIIEFTEIKQEEVEKPEPQVQEQQTTSKVANIVSMSTGNTREKADFSDLVQENQETPGVIIKRSPLDDLLGDNFKKYINDKKKEMDETLAAWDEIKEIEKAEKELEAELGETSTTEESNNQTSSTDEDDEPVTTPPKNIVVKTVDLF